MAEARGLQNVNSKVGSFVLITLLIAGTCVFLAGRAQGWFERTLIVRTRAIPFPADSTLGLQNGAEVQILGNTVGTVEEVNIFEETDGPEPGLRLQFTMHVRGKMLDLVRKDSKVVIQRKFNVAGSAFVQITPGRGDRANADSELSCSIARDLTRMVEETLDSMNNPRSPMQQSLKNVELLTSNLVSGKGTVGRLLVDDSVASELAATVANVNSVTARLKNGEGAAGKLLTDPQAAEQIASSVKSLSESLASLEKILSTAKSTDLAGIMEQIRQTLVEVAATTAQLRQQAKDLPGLIAQTQEMMRQTTRMIEGIQKTWILRDHVAPEGGNRLSPADAGAP